MVSTQVYMSAIFDWIIWKDASGLPNCSRVFAYSIDNSSARSAMPRQIGAITARSRSRPLITTATPSFSAPTRFSAGTRQLSNTSSPVWLPRKPIFTSFCATLKPG